MASSPSFLFYDDEDKILPLLLHSADTQGLECHCRDCLSLRARMKQIELLQAQASSDQSRQASNLASVTPSDLLPDGAGNRWPEISPEINRSNTVDAA